MCIGTVQVGDGKEVVKYGGGNRPTAPPCSPPILHATLTPIIERPYYHSGVLARTLSHCTFPPDAFVASEEGEHNTDDGGSGTISVNWCHHVQDCSRTVLIVSAQSHHPECMFHNRCFRWRDQHEVIILNVSQGEMHSYCSYWRITER